MKRIKEKFANWILRNSTLRWKFAVFFDQYAKFGVVAKQTFFDAETVLEIGHEFRMRLENEQLPISIIDTVPRRDFESLRIAYERHILLVSSLQKEVTDLQRKLADASSVDNNEG